MVNRQSQEVSSQHQLDNSEKSKEHKDKVSLEGISTSFITHRVRKNLKKRNEFKWKFQ